MLCSRSARAVVHVRRVPEVAVHPAADLGRERDPRVALVREVPDEGPEGLLARPPPRQPKEDPLFTHILRVPHARPVSCLPAHAAPGGRAGIVAPAHEQEEPAAARLTYASRRLSGAPRRNGLGRRRGPAEAVDRDAPGPALGADLGLSDDPALPARAGRRVVSVRLALYGKRARCKVDC